jgi:drug/metabolite transporter (DMT)-like permease
MSELTNTYSSLDPNERLSAWMGAGWKMLSFACFAGINGVVKYLSGGATESAEFALSIALPTNAILFWQNLFGTLFLLPFLLKSKPTRFIQTHFALHIIRAVAAVLGVGLWYLTLKKMPIAMGVALGFTGPIFTVIGAKLMLGESLGPKRSLAILISLLGAFIISRPDKALFGETAVVGLVALLPLSSALVVAWNKLLTRKLAAMGESAESLATYLLLLMTPVSFLIALPEWVMPSATHWPWLILLGLLAASAHLSFSLAYKRAEVTFLTPFGFSKFIFSALIGYYCFAEVPSSTLLVGLCVIGLSIFLLVPGTKQKLVLDDKAANSI